MRKIYQRKSPNNWYGRVVRVGDKLLCKKSSTYLEEGKEYVVEIGDGPFGKKSYFVGSLWLSVGVYKEYFYTKKEYRKMKLDKINIR